VLTGTLMPTWRRPAPRPDPLPWVGQASGQSLTGGLESDQRSDDDAFQRIKIS